MGLIIKLIVIFLAVIVLVIGEETWYFVGNPLINIRPCNGTNDISISYEHGLPPDKENEYPVYIGKSLPEHSKLELVFDSEASVKLNKETAESGRISANGEKFTIRFFKAVNYVSFTVKGPNRGTVPYFKSVKINTREYCSNPTVGFLDGVIQGYKDTASIELTVPDGCGRRKVQHTELIVNGEDTKPGDWPWHAAIYRINRSQIQYICGGTLISKSVVLTAAHCATIRGVPVTPEILSVVLGKYNLIGGDLESQEREVHSIIVHEDFAPKAYLNDDIALLKLKSEATYNDYVQPACIWNSPVNLRLSEDKKNFGTVVGWGFDQTDSLSAQLKQASMPIVIDVKCIKLNPLFYSNVLGNDKKFCAGWANGTSACNGDSGGGFVVFVPDTPQDNSPDAVGSYYVRGIVSLSASRNDVALCDPNQYVVFTDVEKYVSWIQSHLD